MALKLAMDREQMVKQILQGEASIGNDFPINQSYALFSDDIEQHLMARMVCINDGEGLVEGERR